MVINGNLGLTLTVVFAALLLEPLIVYKHHRIESFSLEFYLNQLGFFSLLFVPLSGFIFWKGWLEHLKKNRGYGWIGKFEVRDKRASLISYYLLLSPGHGNKVRINRRLFYQTRAGDFVTVTRDALGNIKEVKKLNGIKARLTKTRVAG
jgi:hypothetical protein